MPAVARLDSPAQRTETGTMAPGKEHRGQLGFFDAPESLRVRAVGKKVDATRKRKIRDSLQSERKLKATPEALPDKSVDKSAGEAHKENNMDDSASAATRKLCRAGSAAAAPDAVSTATAIATKEKPIPRFQGRPLAPPRNIVHQLDQRRIGQWKGKVTPSRMPWTTASWLKLQCPRSGRPLTGACLLEWDPMGVLLAIMTQQDGILRIYDWDTVSASDAKGRNHRLRRKTNPDQKYTGGSYRIDSTLQINVRIAGQDVRKLVWNPFDPDQIAILDRNNMLHLFDLGAEAARQQKRRGGAATPTKVEIPLPRHLSAEILFLAADTMVVTGGDQIACVSLRKSSRRAGGIVVPSLKWKYSWKGNVVSAIVGFGNDRVLLASSRGFLSVLNWKKCQKSTFAVDSRPTILSSWFSGTGLQHPGTNHMEIRCLAVGNTQAREGDSRITWIASCGWALSAIIDLKDGKPIGKSTVLQETTPVRFMNHHNETIPFGGRGWSVPSKKIQMAGTAEYLCWERVPDIVHVLPDHDKFVLNDRPRQISVLPQPGLHVMDRKTGQSYELSLPKGQQQITAVGMHTSHEWILVATDGEGVRLYCAREKI